MRRVEIGDRAFVLYNHAGTIYATSDVCPHKGAPLSSGDFEDGVVICPLHAWEFDVRTGRCLSMDDWPGVPTCEVRIDGEIVRLVVEVDERD